jgi:hypothetical protein
LTNITVRKLAPAPQPAPPRTDSERLDDLATALQALAEKVGAVLDEVRALAAKVDAR